VELPREYVQAILRGDYESAELEPPRLDPYDLDELAESFHERARRPRRFPDPRHLAVANGLVLIPRAPSGYGGEATALGRIAYRWHPDPQVRGLHILHGAAHAILHTESGASTEADAWLLTGALAIPPRSMAFARACPASAAAHVPLWLVFARVTQANLCRVAGL
jgi:hypothetical protein